jgi:hypothetical protein
MAIPNVNVTILDGALGLSPGSSDRIQVKIGCSSAGVANVLTAVSSISDLQTQFGYGPLVEAAARVLAIAGGPVYVMKVTSDVAAAMTAVTATQTGTATLTLTGSLPYDFYELEVDCVAGGATLAAGTATFKYSLDAGRTFSPVLAVPVSGIYPIPNSGVTLTWTYSSGTGFVVGDKWVATGTAPGYTTSALATTMTALLADPRTWFMAHAVGRPVDLAAARSLFAALATHMATAAAAYRYAFALMETPDGQTDSALLALTTGFGDLADSRVAVGGGYLDEISPISGRAYKRNVAYEAASWASAVSPSSDLGEVARGPLSGVTLLVRDEQATPSLDAGRFTTARTIIGRQGFYLTRGRIMASAGSDYSLIQNRRVIDIAASTARDGALQFLNSKVATKPNGTIAERAARAIEGYIKSKLDDALTNKGDAVACAVSIDRTVNIVSTGILKVRVRVQPYGYASDIEIELGFTSPSIAAAA